VRKSIVSKCGGERTHKSKYKKKLASVLRYGQEGLITNLFGIRKEPY